jgi:hypothetical protein
VRTLSWAAVEDILLGASIRGCGGGGELDEGRELLRAAYDDGLAVTLVAPDELAADALVATVYGVGGLVVGVPEVYAGYELVAEHPGTLAARALARHIGRPLGALLTGELGGTSIADAFVPAAQLDLPVVDADPVGRAVPEIEHSLFNVRGLPIAPQVVVNEIGDTVIVTEPVDDHRAEALIRALALASRNVVWVADHGLAWGELRRATIEGAIGAAQLLGAACRAARAGGGDVVGAVAAAGGGAVLARGRVAACDWEERDGFTWGETTLAATGARDGATWRVWFKNENLMAFRDGEARVTAPDLIALLRPDGTPVGNPNLRVGEELALVALPAPAAWREPAAYAVLGPRALGFDVDYVAFEERLGTVTPAG